jgi:hypothetical protein
MTNRQITWIARQAIPMFVLMCVAVRDGLDLAADHPVASGAYETGRMSAQTA